MNRSPIKIIKTNAILGEGLSYLTLRNKVIAFDIIAKRLFLIDPENDWSTEVVDIPFMGSCAMEMNDGQVLLAGGQGLYLTQNFVEFSLVLSHTDDQGMRTNDGKQDPHGRFWYSLMSVRTAKQRGSIFCFEPEKRRSELMFGNLTIPNSISFDKQLSRGYYSDSAEGIVYKFDYKLPRQTKEVFLDFSGRDFVPDGAVVDNLSRLWIAQWGNSCVACYDSYGSKVSELRLPVSQPSCPLIVDDEFILVTTAKQGLKKLERANQHNAGDILIYELF